MKTMSLSVLLQENPSDPSYKVDLYVRPVGTGVREKMVKQTFEHRSV